MNTDEQRLKFLMQDIDSYFRVSGDRFDYAYDIAIMHGRQQPSDNDYYEGFLAMVDEAMLQHNFKG